MKSSIEKAEWDNFIEQWGTPEWQRNLRYGQAFYNYFNLFKMKQTPELDCLYITHNDFRAGEIIDHIFEIQ